MSDAVQPVLSNRSPDELQRAASDPHSSIWVGASAGTGKTKVLTDRVLRLLLPRLDGRDGTQPSRILCLTFTKAAANEMAVRIHETLGRWAVMDLDHADSKKSLRAALQNLLGHEPTEKQIARAQCLFAQVIDCPGGLQIMTIHSFCRSILGRFPIEAGVSPNFGDMDEAEANQLVRQAQQAVLMKAQSDEYAGSELSAAVHTLASELDEDSFARLIEDMCKERFQFDVLLSRKGGVEQIVSEICAHYQVTPDMDAGSALEAFARISEADERKLLQLSEAMIAEGGKQDKERGGYIQAWVKADVAGRVAAFDDYKRAFLKKDDGQYSFDKYPSKATKAVFPEAEDVIAAEALRVFDMVDSFKRIKSVRMTRALMVIGREILSQYSAMKDARGALDFDDLILRTLALLSGTSDAFASMGAEARVKVPNWIMYKMDQGLDHILVDEAQDTNPEQWRIIEALCDDFFNGMSARSDVERTSFTVGDIKQSIYSFQRAAPEEFKRMQNVFDRKIKNAGMVNRSVNLDISFRSTQSVLRVVDDVFADPELNASVEGGVIRHDPHREGQEGVVELWPFFESQKSEPREYWDAPIHIREYQSGSSQLAEYIAEKIRDMLDRKEILGAYDRAIEPGDIMILVRSRTAIVEQIMRALKRRNVPVSGADRMTLNEQIAVQDLLALARFCLCTSDDLALAEVLKSPLVGWGEDDLFALAYNRKGDLWSALCQFDRGGYDAVMGHDSVDDSLAVLSDERRERVRDYLSRLSGRVKTMGAYEFFSYVLMQACPADGVSGLRGFRARLGEDCVDSIEEFMNAALVFSQEEIDHVQLFLDAQEQSTTQIKREMEERGNQVRIMTIHGSKGLQAPIVIMPDTIFKKGGKSKRLLWPDKTGLGFPIFSARSADDNLKYGEAFDALKRQEEHEAGRLLYVAMTRAADRLYVAGVCPSKAAYDGSWYARIAKAMEDNPNCIDCGDGVLRIENKQDAKPDKAKDARDEKAVHEDLPQWAYEDAPEVKYPMRPLMPSRPSKDDEEITHSPLSVMDNHRFRRGNITHKLLQFLPDFEDVVRRGAAVKFVRKIAHDLSDNVQQSIVDEVMAILENHEFAPFFAQGSLAEVSITGVIDDHRVISGQIDRLVVQDSEIWIVDYKTNRPPPREAKDVPDIYRKQMDAYAKTIASIYPNRVIHKALLWTDGPFLTLL